MFSRMTTLRALVVLGYSLFAASSWASGLSGGSNNVWQHLRNTFRLPVATQQAAVARQIKWYVRHQSAFQRIAAQAAPYLYYVYHEVHKRHLPGELALLPVIESNFNPFTYSHAGAAGLWQIMPGTGSGFGLKQNWWYDGRRDIYQSTHAALHYLTYLHRFFDGDWLLAIAAYDSGEGTVQHAVRRNRKQHLPTQFWALSLPRETQQYVPRLLALAAIIRQPQRYGVTLPRIPNRPFFVKIDVGSQIDLAHAAKLAGVKLTLLYKLNPGYNRWATDPNGPFNLVLPVDKVDHFKAELAKLPKKKRVTWRRHMVQSGDSLSRIAHHYHTRAHLISSVNHLHSNVIRPKQVLLIPQSAQHLSKATIARQRHYVVHQATHIGPRRLIHQVKRGESYWVLARCYHVKGVSIRFWNHLPANKPLRVGQKLLIWTAVSGKNHGSGHNPASPIRYHYHVRLGDTLGGIAHTLHVSLKKLLAWNPHIKPRHLHPKQQLVFYRRLV